MYYYIRLPKKNVHVPTLLAEESVEYVSMHVRDLTLGPD